MICPKCGRPVEEAAVICPGCDFILDTDFLGGDILDEEHQLRPGQGGVDPAVFNLADAVILGNIGDDSSSFETSDSGFHIKKDMQAARLYVSGRSQAVMSPDAVIAAIADVSGVRLTPFEKHVLRFIDGKRPVESIRRQAGLDEAEVKTALANLADKGVVKVVGRALSDVADFDSETAPGNAPKSKPRRMRGTLVGAVVVVGDAADQAIDDAFRTQVRAAPKLNDLRDLDVDDRDDADVFSSDSSVDASAEDSAESSSDRSVRSAVPPPVDDDDDELFEAGTAEVPVRGGRMPTSSTSTVRPAVVRDAVNAGRGRTGRIATSSRPHALSDVDASDGFDDFGDASDLATAVVAAPSLSEDSSLPGADVQAPLRGGVFADPAPPPVGLSDLEDFDDPAFDDLADSRVEPRPILPPLPSGATSSPRAAPPAMPSLSGGSDAHGSAEESLNEEERAAFSGGVWDDDALPGARRPPADEAISDEDDPFANDGSGNDDDSDLPDPADEPTNVRPPQSRPATNARSELSTSLSALLDSDEDNDDDDSIPGPTAPQVPSAKTSHPQKQRPRVVIDSAEENTAFRPPPTPIARSPIVAGSGRRPPTPPPMQLDSGEESTVQGRFASSNGIAPAAARPAPTPDADRVGAADDLFPDDDDDELSQPTQPPMPAPRAPPHVAPQAAWPTPPPPSVSPPPARPSVLDDDDDPNKTGWYEPGAVSQPSQSVEGFGLLATEQVAAMPRPAISPATRGVPLPRGPAMDVTMPPSVEAAVDDDSSAWSDSGMPPRRPQPPPPEPSRFDARVPASASRGAPGPTNVAALPTDGSSEILDSAMVIRPAIKAVPLALAVKKAKGAPAPQPPQTPPPVGDDEDDFMVDPDATMNLPPLPRSKEGEARKRRAPSLAEASGPVAIAEPAPRENPNRRAPTEDMRRKARNLMEQAQQDHAVGRLGAARMNAKLATIYDPDNDGFKRILADWEERPKAGGAGSGVSSAINSRPEYVQLYETAQELEDDDDIDGALAMLEKGLRLAPNAAAFHNRIGVILAMRKRDFERASDEIQKAIALEPDNPHYRNNLGKVMAKANKRRSAATGT